jgi:aldose 1-epimerase
MTGASDAGGGDGGGLVALESGDLRVEVAPGVGARLHRIRAFGHDVLRTPPSMAAYRESPFLWGGFVMVPWCNRVPDGRIEFGDRVVEVPCNQDDDGARSAIHGLAYDRPWAPLRSATGTAAGWRHEGGDELPWRWSATQHTAIDGERGEVSVTLAVRNEGEAPMPAGIGLHPWFTADGGLQVRLAADRIYEREGMIPVGPAVPVSGRLDLRRAGPPVWGMDDVYTGVGDPLAELTWPERHLRCEIHVSPAGTHGVACAVEAMHAVAVEAQTETTDPYRRLQTGEEGGAAVLAPGDQLELGIRLRFDLTL